MRRRLKVVARRLYIAAGEVKCEEHEENLVSSLIPYRTLASVQHIESCPLFFTPNVDFLDLVEAPPGGIWILPVDDTYNIYSVID